MNKKLIAVFALLPLSAFAQTAVVPLGGASATATSATCAYIASATTSIKLTTSQNVAAAYQCSSTGAVTGAAHMQGKKHGYVTTSGGGGQQEVTLNANPTTVSDTTALTGDAKWTTSYSSL